jgi:hypothetical protein
MEESEQSVDVDTQQPVVVWLSVKVDAQWSAVIALSVEMDA